MVLYHEYIKEMIKHFKEISFRHFPREENQLANALATLALIFKIDIHNEIQPIKIDLRSEPTHCMNIEGEEDKKPWYYDLM